MIETMLVLSLYRHEYRASRLERKQFLKKKKKKKKQVTIRIAEVRMRYGSTKL